MTTEEKNEIIDAIHEMRKDFNNGLKGLEERLDGLEKSTVQNSQDIDNLYSLVSRLAAQSETRRRDGRPMVTPQHLYEELDHAGIPRREALQTLASEGKLRRSCGKNTIPTRVDGKMRRMVVLCL